jgi:hypothetical protein
MVIGLHRRKSFRQILWTPANLTTAPLGWFSADNASNFTFSSGIKVSSWLDKSGNNNHVSQANTSFQPDYLSGNNSVQFVKINSSSGESLQSSTFTLSVGDMFAVFAFDGFDSYNGTIVTIQTNAHYGIFGHNVVNATPTPGVTNVIESNALTSMATTTLNGGVAEITAYPGLDLTSYGSFNTHLYSIDVDSLITNTSLAFAKGSGAGTTLFGLCQMKEAIYLGYQASASDFTRIEGYLAWRHGVTLAPGHPYFAAPPYV